MSDQNTITQGVPPVNSTQLPDPVVPWKFGINQKLQYKQGKFSRLNINNPGTLSNSATATGTIQAGSTLFITDTLTPQPPHGTAMNFAVPYVSVYVGTTNNTSNQIYPLIGGSQSWGGYSFQVDFDWDKFVTTTPGSVISTYNMTIHNNGTATGTFFYVNQWKYLNFNSGTVQ